MSLNYIFLFISFKHYDGTPLSVNDRLVQYNSYYYIYSVDLYMYAWTDAGHGLRTGLTKNYDVTVDLWSSDL